MSSTTSDDDGFYNRRGRYYPTLMERTTSRLTFRDVRKHVSRVQRISRFNLRSSGRSLAIDRSRFSTELASLASNARTLFPRGRRVGERRTRRGLTDEVVSTGWRRCCEFRSSSSSLSARRRCRASLILLSCNTKTRKTTGYIRCVFASRAPSRKDAVGILAGAERCAILIVTENRERGRGGDSSFFLLLDVRSTDLHHNVSPWACTRMFANSLPLPLLRARCSKYSYSLSFLEREKQEVGSQKPACYLITESFVFAKRRRTVTQLFCK